MSTSPNERSAGSGYAVRATTGPFNAAVPDAGARQDLARVEKQALQDQVDREHGFVPAQRLVPLRIVRAQPARVQRTVEVAGDALVYGGLDERGEGRVVGRDGCRWLSAREPLGGNSGHERVERRAHGCGSATSRVAIPVPPPRRTRAPRPPRHPHRPGTPTVSRRPRTTRLHRHRPSRVRIRPRCRPVGPTPRAAPGRASRPDREGRGCRLQTPLRRG